MGPPIELNWSNKAWKEWISFMRLMPSLILMVASLCLRYILVIRSCASQKFVSATHVSWVVDYAMTWLLPKQLKRYDKTMLLCVSHFSFPLAPIVGVCWIIHLIISVGMVVLNIFSLNFLKSSFVPKKIGIYVFNYGNKFHHTWGGHWF